MEMKMESVNTSAINDSPSTTDMQGDGHQSIQCSSSRNQSSRTIFTEVTN